MTLCTYTQRWSSGRHRDASNVYATMKPEASLLISHSGSAVHIGESIPACQVLDTINFPTILKTAPQVSSPTKEGTKIGDHAWLHKVMRPTWQGQQTRAMLIDVMFVTCVTLSYVSYMRQPISVLRIEIFWEMQHLPSSPEATKEQPIESLKSSRSQIQIQVI